MKSPSKSRSPHEDGLTGIEPALQRAAQRARETAARTGTPLVFLRNGKIEKQIISPSKKSKSE